MMRKRSVKYYLALTATILYFHAPTLAQNSLQKVSAHVYTRQAEKGYFTAVQSNLYYTADGNLVSDFSSPTSFHNLATGLIV